MAHGVNPVREIIWYLCIGFPTNPHDMAPAHLCSLKRSFGTSARVACPSLQIPLIFLEKSSPSGPVQHLSTAVHPWNSRIYIRPICIYMFVRKLSTLPWGTFRSFIAFFLPTLIYFLHHPYCTLASIITLLVLSRESSLVDIFRTPGTLNVCLDPPSPRLNAIGLYQVTNQASIPRKFTKYTTLLDKAVGFPNLAPNFDLSSWSISHLTYFHLPSLFLSRWS